MKFPAAGFQNTRTRCRLPDFDRVLSRLFVHCVDTASPPRILDFNKRGEDAASTKVPNRFSVKAESLRGWVFSFTLVVLLSVPVQSHAETAVDQPSVNEEIQDILTDDAPPPVVEKKAVPMVVADTPVSEMQTEPSEFNPWQVRVGPAYRFRSSFKVNWSQHSVRHAISQHMRRQSSDSVSLSSATGYADRDYVDGFVYRDLGTEDPETEEPGLTWYWGYDNASQYDGSSIAFDTGATRNEQSTAFVDAEGVNSDKNVDSPGIDLSGAWRAKRIGENGNSFIGISGGFSWFSDQDAHFTDQHRVARETATTVRYTDHYSAPYPQFPAAPYAGTLEGPGYLINNIPDARTADTISSRSVDWIAHSDLELDVSVFDFRLGPSLWYECSERYFARVTSHLRLAYVELDATANTIVTAGNRQVAQFRAADREKDWVWGAGIELELGIRLSNTWLLGFSGAYDWWADDVAVSADPYRADFELGNWTVMATIGREF